MPTSDQFAAYFNSRLDALTSASRAGIKRSSQELAKEANRQLGQNFTKRAGRAKAKFFPARGTLPDAAIVSIKPGFLEVFEEGAEIKGDRYLVIPIPPFKRVGGRGWGATYQALKNRGKVAIIPVKEGYLITLNKQPAYKLQRAVTIDKRTDIISKAREIGDRIPEFIDEFL